MYVKSKKHGQSLVEVVVSIGLVALVISGVVTLVVNSLGARNKGFDRKKATELAQKVTEKMLADKISNPNIFWQQSYWTNNFGSTLVDSGFAGYSYRVTAIPNIVDPGCIGAAGGYNGCVEARVDVNWVNNATGTTDPTNTVIFTRFFSRY